jgi:hypothetical protein
MTSPFLNALNGQDQNMTKLPADPRLCVVDSLTWSSEHQIIADRHHFAIPKMMPM